MEVVLIILERLVLVGIALFALYQCFQVKDSGRLARPVASWTVRIGLIAVAGVCLLTLARLAGTG
jgi:hypothetical protein